MSTNQFCGIVERKFQQLSALRNYVHHLPHILEVLEVFSVQKNIRYSGWIFAPSHGLLRLPRSP
ncbi:hypothetical protein WN55_08091 [Dufourea novaeangliae]|uniref:Uncharacterized protein n=1 Tax=Dufourea novaeangliae TaxID=178035 RepID=A0A154P765_DUFNO|nr:hypothetical protein WN55_08091 [Dufourea novaeangliae]